MFTPAAARRLLEESRSLASVASADPEGEVAHYLTTQLAHLQPSERLQHLELMAQELGGQSAPGLAQTPEAGEVHRLVARFLGRAQGTEALSAEELADSFGAALDALFDSLNEIVSVINVTLLGGSPELETIRKVIGSNLHGETAYSSIRIYLERIQRSFLAAHQSFQSAAATIVGELLAELDPEGGSGARISGLKFGPLRKAELFDQYAEKHDRCQRWYGSEQFRERLLREFEKECQMRMKRKGG